MIVGSTWCARSRQNVRLEPQLLYCITLARRWWSWFLMPDENAAMLYSITKKSDIGSATGPSGEHSPSFIFKKSIGLLFWMTLAGEAMVTLTLCQLSCLPLMWWISTTLVSWWNLTRVQRTQSSKKKQQSWHKDVKKCLTDKQPWEWKNWTFWNYSKEVFDAQHLCQ